MSESETETEARISVEVVYALPDRHWRVGLSMPTGATVAEALAMARMADRVPGLRPETLGLGIFGHKAEPGTVLADGDRVELLRPLRADPKEARRRRQAGKPAGADARGEDSV